MKHEYIEGMERVDTSPPVKIIVYYVFYVY